MAEDVEKPKLKRRKDLMTISELLEELGIHPEDSGREMVQFLLSRGATDARRRDCVSIQITSLISIATPAC